MTEYRTPRQGGVNIALQVPIPEDVKARVIALRGQGWSGPKIAREVGLTQRSVYRIFSRHKVGITAAALNLEVGTKSWRRQELARLYNLVANNPSKRDPLDIIEAFRTEEESGPDGGVSQAFRDLIESMRRLSQPVEVAYTLLDEPSNETLLP